MRPFFFQVHVQFIHFFRHAKLRLFDLGRCLLWLGFWHFAAFLIFFIFPVTFSSFFALVSVLFSGVCCHFLRLLFFRRLLSFSAALNLYVLQALGCLNNEMTASTFAHFVYFDFLLKILLLDVFDFLLSTLWSKMILSE